MGRIQSNVGLITGIPITDTVDQLIQVASQPRDLLASRNRGLQQQQIAVNSLSSRLLSLKFSLGKLKVSDPFQSRAVTSSNEEAVTANITSDGQPSLGNYNILPVRTASSQQLISQQFESLDDIQSTGSLSFGYGGFVNKGISLDELNNGDGVSRGEIKITDLAGNSATIDLSVAQSVDDVVEAINNTSAISVTAAVSGDSFTLTGNVGSANALTVEEVNGGTTAADLGLDTINETVAGVADAGSDVFSLHSGTKLTRLNDGNGVRVQAGTADLIFAVADGTENLSLDLSDATTLGDVVDAINNAETLGTKISAAISADGNRLELTDLTGNDALTVTSGAAGSAAEDLGLTGTVSGDTLTGDRLVAGLQDTLLSSLNGGAGLGTLGSIDVTDRNGGTATVDLSAAETLGGVIDAINASAADITAAFSSSGSGLTITDNTGGVGNLQISGASADALGITVDAEQDSINSGTLNRQTLSEATQLSDLNGGEGITASDIRITDSNGSTDTLDLNASGSEAETIGDVIEAINASTNIDVTASINSTGDGILITDNSTGTGNLAVTDVNGTLAADLNLTRASTTVDDQQVIDGTSSYSVDLSDIEGDATAISLSSLNDGAGITKSDIKITDSDGDIIVLDLNGGDADITTVGQLIDRINDKAEARGVKVTASINDAGTGIKIVDNANGSGDFTIEDVNGTAAADLKILTTDNTTDTVKGSGLFSAQTASQGALNTVAERINDLEAGVTASVLNDGKGFRLQLVVDETGSANEILLQAGDTGFEFEETSSARDALLVVGGQGTPGSGILITSTDNDYSDVINGVDLNVNATTDSPVTIIVEKSDEELIDAVDDFVSAYNTLRSDLDNLTDFNEDDFSTGLLFGTNEALRVDTQLSRIATDRYFGVGSFQSLEEIGLSVDDQGKLALDKTKFQEAFADDAQSLQTFFTDENNGIVAKFDSAIESLAGAENGLLTNRNESLQATIDLNTDRIDRFNESLDRQRETLLLQFFQLEQVIAGLQQSQTALGAIQPLAPLVST